MFNEVPTRQPKNFTGNINLGLWAVCVCYGVFLGGWAIFWWFGVFYFLLFWFFGWLAGFFTASSHFALCFASTDESECNMGRKIPHAQNGNKLEITG